MNPIELAEMVEKLESNLNQLAEKVLQLGQLNIYNNLSLIALIKKFNELEKKFEEIKED